MKPAIMQKASVHTLFFWGGLLICLLPLMVCDYIVTADGPCHLYNSKVLVRWLIDGQGAFFHPWLQLNQYIDPNWITNAIQIPLLIVLPVIWAEKLFFAIYLLGFAFGFQKVVDEVNPSSRFLAMIGMLFAWNYILMKGFTNNAWSVVLWFWILAYWMKSLKKPGYKVYGILTLLFILQYLSHPVGLVFSFLSVASIVFMFGLLPLKENGVVKTIRWYLLEAGKLLLCAAVPIYLFILFYLRREWKAEATSTTLKDIGRELLNLRALNTLTFDEEPFLLVTVGLILALAIYVVYGRIKSRRWNPFDGLLLLFCLSLWVVLHPPSSFTGGLEIGVRLGMFPFLCLMFWMATYTFHKRVQITVSAVALLIAGGLMALRLPIHQEASKYAEEIVTVQDSIRNQSSLLVLNYDWGGQDAKGKVIAERMWLFGHVDCYLGTYKDLAISDNYEANFWYFPLVEHWETNMYMQTDKDGINFDHRPPRADINSYKRRTGQQLDYVLLLSYRDEFASHPYTKEIFGQLDAEYQKTYTSALGRAVLYKRIVY